MSEDAAYEQIRSILKSCDTRIADVNLTKVYGTYALQWVIKVKLKNGMKFEGVSAHSHLASMSTETALMGLIKEIRDGCNALMPVDNPSADLHEANSSWDGLDPEVWKLTFNEATNKLLAEYKKAQTQVNIQQMKKYASYGGYENYKHKYLTPYTQKAPPPISPSISSWASELYKKCPGLGQTAKCPKCTHKDAVWSLIQHINDNIGTHGMNRRDIIDWLWSLDIDLEIKELA